MLDCKARPHARWTFSPTLCERAGAHRRVATRFRLRQVFLSFVTWLTVALGVTAQSAVQAADVLPFVEPGGLLRAGLTRGMVVSELGSPPVMREYYEAGDPPVAGALIFEYPDVGLAFVIPPVERAQADPRIAYLVVKPPARLRTPEGVGLGMHLSEVRTRTQEGRLQDKGGRIEWIGGPGAGSRKASFVVSTGNVVSYMVFDAGIPHEPAYKKWIKEVRWMIAVVLAFALVLSAPWLLKGYSAYVVRRIEVLAPLRARLGKGMLVLSPVLVILGVPLAREGGPVALLGVILILGGVLLLLPAAYNLALGGRLTPARALALGLVGLAVLILSVLFR